MGVQLENNGSTNLTVTRTFERLVEPFAIRPDIAIPEGDYDYLNYTASFNAGNQRKIDRSGSYTWGEFWNGHTKSLTGALGLRPNYHWSLDLNYTRNDVTLAERRLHDGPGRRALSLCLHPAGDLQRVPSVQRRYASNELQHPLQSHPSPPERHLPCLQRHQGHQDWTTGWPGAHRQGDEPVQLLKKGSGVFFPRIVKRLPTPFFSPALVVLRYASQRNGREALKQEDSGWLRRRVCSL